MKKNIIILLLIPFLIALFSVITINATVDIISPDILSIEWDYQDHEGFKLREAEYELKARGNTLEDIVVEEGNQLVFEVKNVDETKDPLASVSYHGGHYYLKTLDLGEVIISCHNKKGNVFKEMKATIYDKGAILINPEIKGSQMNIDETIYYGSYDLKNEQKVPSEFKLKFTTVPSSLGSSLYVKDYSIDTIESVDIKTGLIKLKKDAEGKSFINFALRNQSDITASYNFEVVKDGINVYNYDDLLFCTNESEEGEKVVLRKSFESLSNAYDSTNSLKSNNVELFGTYKDSKFNFKNEIYTFETDFNSEYIKKWNEFAKSSKDYKGVSNLVKAGLHVQKDFYGNGYTINMHNLTYPSQKTQLENGLTVPTLGRNDLFRGPLPFYTLGDPNGLPLITAYGQDNVGMYVEGDNITINDLNIKNCDFENSLSNLNYVGTVVDITGSNNKIINTRISNGKNVLRAYSNDNLLVDNCLLQNARNFLMNIGSNEFIKIDGNKKVTIQTENGNVTNTISSLLKKRSEGDVMMNDYIQHCVDSSEKNQAKERLMSLHNALNDSSLIEDIYKNEVNINDTLFYRSGIASVSLDTMFNGPFLYEASPSYLTDTFSKISFESKPIVPLAPTEIGGISYPSLVNVEGNTKFYDYKDIKKMDITGLINENISVIAKDIFDSNEDIGGMIDHIPEVNIDKIFPIKPMLEQKAGSKYSYIQTKGDETIKYVNVPFAYYGGGLNLTKVNYSNIKASEVLSPELPIDLLDAYLDLKQSESLTSQAKNLMLKTVTTVTGFEPFKFVLTDNSGYLFGETPNVNELKQNLKERA